MNETFTHFGPWGLVALTVYLLGRDGVKAYFSYLKKKRDICDPNPSGNGHHAELERRIAEEQMWQKLVENSIRQTALMERLVDGQEAIRNRLQDFGLGN